MAGLERKGPRGKDGPLFEMTFESGVVEEAEVEGREGRQEGRKGGNPAYMEGSPERKEGKQVGKGNSDEIDGLRDCGVEALRG